jgi:hypothetical protein
MMTLKASYYAGMNYYPADMMQRDADWIVPGVLSMSDLTVSPTTPSASMAVVVSGAAQGQVGGNAWLPGGYRIYNDANQTLTVQAADPTYPRIDLVIASIDTSANPYTPSLQIIKGTAALSPVAPAIPANLVALVLAQLNVSAADTSIASGDITDKRTTAYLTAGTSDLITKSMIWGG